MSLGYKRQNLKKITAIVLAVLFLDQAAKFIVVRNIFFEVEIYKNYNVLFGLPVDFGLVLFIILIFVFAKNILNFEKKPNPEASGLGFFSKFKIAPGLILGGILGNLTDRFFYGYIIDYFNLFNLFVFNIADLAICFGVLLLSWKILKK